MDAPVHGEEALLHGEGDGEQVHHPVGLGLVVHHDVELAAEDQRADAREHPLDDVRGDRAKPTPDPENARQDLQASTDENGDAERRQAVVLDELVHQHGETGSGTAHLQR